MNETGPLQPITLLPSRTRMLSLSKLCLPHPAKGRRLAEKERLLSHAWVVRYDLLCNPQKSGARVVNG
jgi:hypothetical protein